MKCNFAMPKWRDSGNPITALESIGQEGIAIWMRPRKEPILPLVMHKIFDGLTEEDLTSLTLNQFEEHQKEIMRRKALDVTVEGVVYRLDRAPALREFKDICKSPLEDEQFFFNKELIQNRNVDTPGAAYFNPFPSKRFPIDE